MFRKLFSKFHRQRQLELHTLEERILFDAAIDGAVPAESSGTPQVEQIAEYKTDQLDKKEDLTRPHEIVFIDASVEDHDELLADLRRNDPTRELEVVLLDAGKNGIEQISSVLSNRNQLDAIHMVSHGEEGAIRLGNVWLNSENLSLYESALRGWANSTTDEADLLIYGCDLAGNGEGQSFINSLSELTQTDVAASVDDTGWQAKGGDWELEFATGRLQSGVVFSEELRESFQGLLAVGPDVQISGAAFEQLGENVTFNVVFSNTGSDVGYGPFVDLIFPVNGPDGAAGTDVPDGIDFVSASYLGQTLNAIEITFPDDDGAGIGTTGTVDHPFALDATGSPLQITGTAGDKLVVLELPFGSFSAGQPDVDIQVTAAISDLADLGTAQIIQARGGFRFGSDPLDNPSTDPSVVSDNTNDVSNPASPTQSWTQQHSITPTLMSLTKTFSGSESETAIGPNFIHQYRIDVDIASGQTIRNLEIIDELPNNIVVTSIDSVTVNGVAAAFSDNLSSLSFPGNNQELVISPTADVTGTTSSSDVSVTFSFYVSEFDANGDRVIPLNGEDDTTSSPDSTSRNNARAIGDWDPIDVPRDAGGTDNAIADPAGFEHVLDDKAIAVQKSVSVVNDTGASGATPGDTLEYVIQFQVSDYYTFGDLEIDDIFQDGQLFDFGYGATFDITDHNGTVTGSFTVRQITDPDGGQSLVVDQTQIDRSDDLFEDGTTPDGSDGSTSLSFNISQALIDSGAADGVLEGGLTRGTTNLGAATGTIRFRTIIQDEFADTFFTGDRSVDQGDVITNGSITIAGTVRENFETGGGSGNINNVIGNESDGSSASTTIQTGALAKEIYAINGSTSLPIGDQGKVTLRPGDTITYRLSYNLATSDFEDMSITDFLPLPVFDVDDSNADGTNGDVWTFDSDGNFDAIAGTIEVGGGDTFFGLSGITPTITVDSANNSVELYYGDYDDPSSQPSRIELYLTVSAQDLPTADGLFLTNIARAEEGTTDGGQTVLDRIVQVEVLQPVLNISKGIVSTTASEVQTITATDIPSSSNFTLSFGGQTTSSLATNSIAAVIQSALESLSSIGVGNVSVSGGPIMIDATTIGSPLIVEFTGTLAGADVATISTSDLDIVVSTVSDGPQFSNSSNGPVNFALPGSSGAAFSSGFNSTDLSNNPIDSDVSGLQAGDLVKFAIVIENTGGADAYDLTIEDLAAAGYVVPATGAGLNLQVRDGDGNILNHTGDLFAGGIQITDPLGSGALNNLDSATTANDGSNILVITYDMELADTVQALDSQQNTASLTGFSGQEGGVNYLSNPRTDSATVTTQNVDASKSIVTTSESHTSAVSGIERVVVGEIVRYRIVVQIPEGTISNLQVRDILPGGLTFLDDGTATVAFVSDNSGLSSSTLTAAGYYFSGNDSNIDSIVTSLAFGDADVSRAANSHNDNYAPSGQDVYFKLGDITNTDNDANSEFAVIEFNALANNISGGSQNDVDDSRANDVFVYRDINGNGNIDTGGNAERIFDMPNGDRPIVRIAEPLVENISKTADVSAGDAGDTITFTVGFTVASGSGRADAFDVNVSDTLPAELSSLAISEVRLNGIAIGAGFTDNTVGNSLQLIFDHVAQGDAIEIDYTAVVQSSISPTDTVTNAAVVTWSSLPGEFGTASNPTGSDLSSSNGLNTQNGSEAGMVYATNSGDAFGERDGSGMNQPLNSSDDSEPNDHHGFATHLFTVESTPALTKTLDGTSIDHTNNSDSEAVIGELVTYTITLNLQEATLSNAQLVDTLDPGLAFVGVTGTSTSGGVNFTGDAINPASVNSNGRIITWDLGTITDSTPSDANNGGDSDGTISITYQAVVTNVSSNQSGQALDNSVEFTWDDDPVSAPNPRESISAVADTSLTVIEPTITLSKTADVDVDGDGFDDGNIADANDNVRYTITLQNTSGVDAFDLALIDNIPLTNSGTQSAILSPTLAVNDTAGLVSNSDFSLSGDNTNGWSLTAVNNFDMLADPARVITITLIGSISVDVQPQDIVTNAASVTWTSIDGSVVNPSGFTTEDTERTGAGGLNDYGTSDSANIIIATPTVLKQIVSTSINNGSTNTNNHATIGEFVQYSVTIDVPEGGITGVEMVDQLSAGLEFVSLDSIVAASDVGTNRGVGDFSDLATFTPSIVGDGAATPFELTFDLGTLTNTNADNSVTEQIVVTYTVRVMNNGFANGNGSASGDTLSNSAFLRWNAGANTTASETVSIEVVEADLEVNKSLASSPIADAGDTVTYVITVQHSSDSDTDAFDVTFSDLLPDELNFTSLTATQSVAGDLNSVFEYDSATRTVRTIPTMSFDLAFGETVTVTISGVLNTPETEPGETVSNTASVQWTSLNDTHSDGDDANERNGNGVGENDYSASDANTSLSIAEPAIAKTLISTSINHSDNNTSEAVIGELATYEVTLTLPEGTFNSLQLLDTLDTGLSFVSLDSITLLSNSLPTTDISTTIGAGDFSDLSSFTPTELAGVQVFDLGTVTNSNTNNGHIEQLVLRYTVRIDNVSTNQSNGSTTGQHLDNTAQIGWTANGVSELSGTASAAEIEIIEPDLDVTKTISDATPNLGDTVTYSILIDHTSGSDADAFDLTLTDLLPVDVTLNSGSISVFSGSTLLTAGVDYSISIAGNGFTISGIDLLISEPAISVNYSGIVSSDPVDVGNGINNTANLSWTSLSGTDANERTGAGGVNAYNDASLETATIVNPDLSISKENGVAVVVPGSTYTYDIVVSNGNSNSDTASGVTVTDFISSSVFDLNSLTTDDPANVAYNNSTGELTWNVGSLAAGSSRTLQVTVTVRGTLAAGIDSVTNTASVVHDDIEPTPLDTVDSDTDVVDANPILTLTKDDGVTSAALNDTVTYTLTYANTGNQDATNVQIIETLPTGSTFAGTVGWADIGGGQYRFDLGTVAAGDSGSISFGVIVDDPQPTAQPELTNSATIDDDNTNGGIAGIDDVATHTTPIPSSLSGRVFNDFDNDGLFDSGDGEQGIGGVTLELYDWSSGSAVFVTSTTTASDGTYSFDNILASTYEIREVQPANFNDGLDSDGSESNGDTTVNDRISSIELNAGVAATDYNFAERGMSISGTVYVDDNRDGNRQAGEGTRIQSVTIELYDATGTTLLGSTTTDSSGNYSFDNLSAGNYIVRQTQPTQYSSSSPNDIPVALSLSDVADQDFGEALWDLGNFVWFDANADGLQTGEGGFAFVDVTLTYAGLDGDFSTTGDNIVYNTTTDANGQYNFTELFNGDYRVTLDNSDLPSGMSGTFESDDTAPAIDGTSNVTINGSDRFDADFGFAGTGTLGDFVFFDVNGDGVQDPEDVGLANITVNLVFAGADGNLATTDDNLTLSTVTDTNGFYSFDNLPGGSFRVSVDALDSDLPGSITPVSGSGSLSGPTDIVLPDNSTLTSLDFGFTGTLEIGDRIWLDADGDGLQDALNEPGFGGVAVSIRGAGQDGTFNTADDIVTSTTTAADGSYNVGNLADGDYRVTYNTADLPDGITGTVETDDIAPAIDGQSNITLSGSDRNDIDFGLRGTGEIGDFVWFDYDADGVQDIGEPGYANVDVNLDFAGTDGIFGTSDDFSLLNVTDATGHYQFESLPDGEYRINVDVSDPDLPMDIVGVSGPQSNSGTVIVNLNGVSGRIDNTVDFGFRGESSIGDGVWYDADGDGVQDTDEPGLPNVQVELNFAGANGIFGDSDDFTTTTTTDQNGNYIFENLPSGNYQIDVLNEPTGTNQTTEQNDSTNSIPGTAEIQLTGNTDRQDVDFGFTGTGSIGDTVYFDLNGSGSQDSGEVGFPGVTVELEIDFDGDGTIDHTVISTTAPNGQFLFENLPAASYNINVVTPAGTQPTEDPDTILDSNTSLILGAGENNLNQDFGYQGTGSIGDSVYWDINGDGVQGPDEVGLPGVAVSLDIDLNNDGTIDQTLLTTTGLDGLYLFSNLPAGSYTVRVSPPTGTAATNDSDGMGSLNQSSLVLGDGENNQQQDFGYRGTGEIGDTVFFDYQGDGGPFDSSQNDRGMSGVDVELTVDVDGNGSIDITRTVTTDANGNFSFGNLIAGDYNITVDSSDLPDQLGSNPTFNQDAIIDDSTLVALSPGEQNNTIDFGFHAAPDYNITKTDNVSSVVPGQTITYNIVIRNDGSLRGQNVVVTDTFPTSVLENLVASNSGTVDSVNGLVEWNIPSLGVGEEITLTLSATIRNPLAVGIENFTNSVAITDDLFFGIDPNTSDNFATDSDVVFAEPDLAIAKSNDAVGNSVTPGQTFNYFLTITNNGDQDVVNAIVLDALPIQVLEANLVSTDDAGNVAYDSNTGALQWSAGPLTGQGGTKTLTVTVTVRDPVNTVLAAFDNQATVSDSGPGWVDPNPLDNTDTNSITLDATPDYEIVKTSSLVDNAMVGDTFEYTIRVTNIGNQDGTGVVVTDVLPVTVIDRNDIVTDDPANVTYDSNTGELQWAVGDLVGRGGNAELKIQVRVPFIVENPLADQIVNTATVADDGTNGPDFNQANNSSTVVDGVTIFAFDTFNNLSFPFTNYDINGPAPNRELQPLPVDPIFSGLAEPGTTLSLRIFDEIGTVLGERQVVADGGGNWVASFPNTIIWKTPHRMEVTQTAPIHSEVEQVDGFNMRRYFHPASHSSLYLNEHLTVAKVLRETAYHSLESMHDANNNPIQVGWRQHLYQLNTASTNVADH